MTKVRRGEEVERDPRRAMTPARKKRIWLMRDGRCGDCGDPVPVDGPGVVYDHRIALWIKGSDADTAFWPLCTECNDKKTNGKGGDLSTIAKLKRIQKKHAGVGRTSKRPIKSRGFDKRLKRKLDGTVERIENRADDDDETDD